MSYPSFQKLNSYSFGSNKENVPANPTSPKKSPRAEQNDKMVAQIANAVWTVEQAWSATTGWQVIDGVPQNN